MSATPADIYASVKERESNGITGDRYLARLKTMGGGEYA
jgi:hypothetical protein